MTEPVEGGRRSLKVFLSHRYFWPDTPPYASLLRTLAERLVAEGHDVTVFSAQPSYRASRAARQPSDERLGGVRVLRLGMLSERGRSAGVRLLNNARYVTGLFAHLIARRDYDVIMAASFPPVFAGRAAALAARLTHTPFLYHCQDLHPEVERISGMLKDGALFRALRRLDAGTCEAAARVVVLSEDMRATLAARPGLDVSNVAVVNNFLPETFAADGDRGPAPALSGAGFQVVFAGNLGRFQGLEAVVDAARLLASETRIHFTFVGDGVAEPALRKRAAELLGGTVHFLPQQPQGAAQRIIRSADLALVTLNRGVYQVAYPSKTLTYLAMGTPLVAAVEAESEMARMIEAEGVGWVAVPEDPRSLASVVMEAFERRQEIPEVRARERALYERRFAADRALGTWVELVTDVAHDAARRS